MTYYEHYKSFSICTKSFGASAVKNLLPKKKEEIVSRYNELVKEKGVVEAQMVLASEYNTTTSALANLLAGVMPKEYQVGDKIPFGTRGDLVTVTKVDAKNDKYQIRLRNGRTQWIES